MIYRQRNHTATPADFNKTKIFSATTIFNWFRATNYHCLSNDIVKLLYCSILLRLELLLRKFLLFPLFIRWTCRADSQHALFFFFVIVYFNKFIIVWNCSIIVVSGPFVWNYFCFIEYFVVSSYQVCLMILHELIAYVCYYLYPICASIILTLRKLKVYWFVTILVSWSNHSIWFLNS